MSNFFTAAIISKGSQPIIIQAKYLKFPAPSGYYGILAFREPIISLISLGIIHIINSKSENLYYGVVEGFFEFADNMATILSEKIITPSECYLAPKYVSNKLNYLSQFKSFQEKVDFVNSLLWKKIHTDKY